MMSVKQKIFSTCFGFVMIIVLLGGMAWQQGRQMRSLVMGIYDRSFVGILFAHEAREQFLRIAAATDRGAPLTNPAIRSDLQAVLVQLDVAIERAGSAHTRAAAVQLRAKLASLQNVPAAALPGQIVLADQAFASLVKRYSSDGLKARDAADSLALRNSHLVLAEVALALCLALLLGLLLGRNLSPPLEDLVRSIVRLTEGDLAHELAPGLSLRRDEIGAVARATAIFRDAMQKNIAAHDERMRLLAESEEARLEAARTEAAMAAKSDFLATMSHEIRTPMNGVATIADLLAETELNADQVKMVGIIRQSSRWLIRVINDILDFSKLEAHQLQIEHVPFMLDEVVEGACQVLAGKAQEKNLALTVQGRDLPGICRIGDPLRLRQIVLNLLGNSVKFTASGSVTVAVHATPDTVIIKVIDTGIGIPADKLDRLFQPYSQIRSDDARAYGGTGLGLSITKNLAALMGGNVAVTSQPGQGSCFTVSLKLPNDSAGLCKSSNRPSASSLRWAKPDIATARAQRAVLLCAEDNAINREVLARVLDRLGFHYDIAEDGCAALAMLDRQRHGLLLTDAQMPQMDGWQLTQTVRQQETEASLPRLPIVLLTANALTESDSRTVAVGMDRVLTKPLNIDALEATLLEALPALGTLRTQCDPRATETPQPPATSAMPGAGLNGAALAELVGDDPETLSALLQDFLASVVAEHSQMHATLASNEPVPFAAHAHSIKGAARYAGAATLAQICGTLEHRAKRGDSFAAMSQDLATLDAEVARLPAEIAAALKKISAGASASCRNEEMHT
jgi:signal transduction histidine kinase/CheY-like chemotaxis protein